MNMTKKKDLLGILLAAVTGASCLTAMLLKTFLPRIILPRPSGITVVALILVALVLDHYAAKGSRRDFWLIPVYGALIFGLFSLASCIAAPMAAGKLAIMGAVCFPVVTFLFDAAIDRLSTSPASKLAPAIAAFGIFLAAQCLMGIL